MSVLLFFIFLGFIIYGILGLKEPSVPPARRTTNVEAPIKNGRVAVQVRYWSDGDFDADMERVIRRWACRTEITEEVPYDSLEGQLKLSFPELKPEVIKLEPIQIVAAPPTKLSRPDRFKASVRDDIKCADALFELEDDLKSERPDFEAKVLTKSGGTVRLDDFIKNSLGKLVHGPDKLG